jgi:hypothetical protein
LPGTVLAGDGPDSILLAHHDHEVTSADGHRVPILTTIVPGGTGGTDRDLTQTRDPAAAAELVAGCPAGLLVAEMTGRYHPPAVRIAAFKATLLALADQAGPAAVWCPTSTSLVGPDELRRHDLTGLVGVRFYRIDGEPGTMVMDTLGLHVLGLPDLQCHFRRLDPNAVAPILYDTAAYVYENGDVIADGHTVAGPAEGDVWRAQHENALVDPARIVLDLDPGDPHAAGSRPRWRPRPRRTRGRGGSRGCGSRRWRRRARRWPGSGGTPPRRR